MCLAEGEGESFLHGGIHSLGLLLPSWIERLTLGKVIFPLCASVFLWVPLSGCSVRHLELQLRTYGFAPPGQ